MLKSYAQQTLEADRGKDIEQIVHEAFEEQRGRRNIVVLVAANLGTSEPTLRAWCRDMGINIDNYRCLADA